VRPIEFWFTNPAYLGYAIVRADSAGNALALTDTGGWEPLTASHIKPCPPPLGGLLKSTRRVVVEYEYRDGDAIVFFDTSSAVPADIESFNLVAPLPMSGVSVNFIR
jgi:hypothetical protein